jgi:hypothetical protein
MEIIRRCCNLIGSCCGSRQIPMILEFLQCPIRFASGLFAYVLLSTFAGPTQAETPTRLYAIVADGILRVGLTEDYRRHRQVKCALN